MLKGNFKSSDSRIGGSKTQASNQFKIVVIGLPDVGSTLLIDKLLNKPYSRQTKIFKVYNCAINTKTLEWRETVRGYQPPTNNKSCIRAVIFEVIATKSIIDLLYLLIAPEDIILLAYNPSLVDSARYRADIDYILNFISAHCSQKHCFSAMHYPHFPVVLMVGIRINPISLHSVNFFRDYCRSKTYVKHILQEDRDAFHFIDKMSITNQIIFLKQVILTTAKPLCNQHCPSAYLQFEKEVLELSKKQTFLKIEKVGEIVGVEIKEQLFNYLRNKGIILYYPKIPALKNKIFLSPKCFALPLVIAFIYMPPDYLSLQNALTQLGPDRLQMLVYLLRSFDLAVAGHWPISKASKMGFKYDDTSFIIPSLADENIVEKLKPKDYIGVIYHFPGGFIPRCVFYQLTTKLIDWLHSDENTINQ